MGTGSTDAIFQPACRRGGADEQKPHSAAGKEGPGGVWTCGKPHRERTRKEARQDDCKNQRTSPSSSVKPGTRVWGRQMPPHWVRPVTSACLSSFPPLLWHVFSRPPCHFQMSSLHPHPPWSLLTSLPASSLIHLLPVSQHPAAKLIL